MVNSRVIGSRSNNMSLTGLLNLIDVPRSPVAKFLRYRVNWIRFRRSGQNDGILIQFTRYLRNLATGDLGTSIKFRGPVSDSLLERLPMTLELTIGALSFAIV